MKNKKIGVSIPAADNVRIDNSFQLVVDALKKDVIIHDVMVQIVTMAREANVNPLDTFHIKSGSYCTELQKRPMSCVSLYVFRLSLSFSWLLDR